MGLFARGQADAVWLWPSYVGRWRRADSTGAHQAQVPRQQKIDVRSHKWPESAAKSYTRWLSILAALLLLAACASSRIVEHGFAFDVISDSPDVELLDYRYGDSKLPGASNLESLRGQGKAAQELNIYGPMRRGDFLYVQWRLKNTGRILAETVDLRNRIPVDITGHKIYFQIKADQLYVYLIPPKSEKRPAGTPPTGPMAYRHLAVRMVYPDVPNR